MIVTGNILEFFGKIACDEKTLALYSIDVNNLKQQEIVEAGFKIASNQSECNNWVPFNTHFELTTKLLQLITATLLASLL